MIFSYKLSLGPTCAVNAVDFIREEGFDCEEHIVHTTDGYILVLHRIIAKDDVNQQHDILTHSLSSRRKHLASTLNLDTTTTNSIHRQSLLGIKHQSTHFIESKEPTTIPSIASNLEIQLPPVLCLHGLMMSSDAFVISGKDSLAFELARSGFDVWLGNLRGNRYTSHEKFSSTNQEFWDFSLDQFARFDIPAMVKYILQQIHLKGQEQQSRLSLVGFSQGSAASFAALVSVPNLQSSIACFAALAPAIALKGISHEGFASLLHIDPNFLFLLFGKKSFLPLVLDIQKILSPTAFVFCLDVCMSFLFGWKCNMINKEKLYTALVGMTSVTNIVHFMEIVRSNSFTTKQRHHNHSQHFVPLKYDIKRVQVPLALFYGSQDSLIDVPRLVRSLPTFSRAEKITGRAGDVLYQQQIGGALTVVNRQEDKEEGKEKVLPLRRSVTSTTLSSSTLPQEKLVMYERHPLLLFEVPECEHLDIIWSTKRDLVFTALIQFLNKHS